MPSISSSVGLISGLNTTDIINQLMSIEAAPVKLLQTHIDNVSQQKTAFGDLATQIGTLKDTGTALKDSKAFQAANANSSNKDVLTATATNGAAVGTYSFQVCAPSSPRSRPSPRATPTPTRRRSKRARLRSARGAARSARKTTSTILTAAAAFPAALSKSPTAAATPPPSTRAAPSRSTMSSRPSTPRPALT